MATKTLGDFSRSIVSVTGSTRRSDLSPQSPIRTRNSQPSLFLYNAVKRFIEVTGDAIDLTGDGGVMKTIAWRPKADAVGPSEDLPLVFVHCECTFVETGEVFDTTHEDNTVFSFEIGKGSVIQAWDIELRTMKVGEVAKNTCKPEYAYGSAGSPPDIPPA